MNIAHGKWQVTAPATPYRVEGTCQKCLIVKAAIDLELKRLPFGRGEQWQCKGGC